MSNFPTLTLSTLGTLVALDNGNFNQVAVYPGIITVEAAFAAIKAGFNGYPNTEGEYAFIPEGVEFTFNGGDWPVNLPVGLFTEALDNSAGVDLFYYGEELEEGDPLEPVYGFARSVTANGSTVYSYPLD